MLLQQQEWGYGAWHLTRELQYQDLIITAAVVLWRSDGLAANAAASVATGGSTQERQSLSI